MTGFAHFPSTTAAYFPLGTDLHFANRVLQRPSGTGSAGSDWSGAFKIAAVCAAVLGSYFVYRHVVVGSSTLRGMADSARGRFT
jgi:hypothetical protein